jgi:hypothetical protein
MTSPVALATVVMLPVVRHVHQRSDRALGEANLSGRTQLDATAEYLCQTLTD